MADYSDRGDGVTPGGAFLSISGVSKSFGGVQAVDKVSLDVAAGEFFALLGPSGCGKTTLLRMLAGFETPDEGHIRLAGADIGDVPPHRRPVNMMFQNYALFPHLSVADNIAFGLRRAGVGRRETAVRVEELIGLARLDGLASRKPDQLSGGQRQRVALARALARRPQVLLLDEPLAALDRKLREETRFELMEVQRKLGTTFIMVTHDQDEAMTVANRIGVMNKGELVQVASPRDLYETPASRWVAGFVGDMNLLEGTVASAADGQARVALRDGGELLCDMPQRRGEGMQLWIAMRPEKLQLFATPPGADAVNVMHGEIVEAGYLGTLSIYKVRLASGITIRATRANTERGASSFSAGDKVWLSVTPDACVLLDW